MIELERILVPLDGSKLSERALPYATAIAQKFDSLIILLRVLDIPQPVLDSLYPEEHWIREGQQYFYREAEAYLAAREAELNEEKLRSRILVRDGSPAEDILHVATDEQVDMIVMSSHGKGAPEGLPPLWTSGSVADKVLQHSSCPVLLVRQSMENSQE